MIGVARLLLLVVEAAAATPAPTPALPALVGTWRGDGFELVLKAGGKGSLSDSPWTPPAAIAWKADKGRLTIVEDGEPTEYAFRLQADRLVVSGGDLEASITLLRVRAAAPDGAALGNDPAAAAAPPAPAQVAPGDCAAACRHYLTCAAAGDAQQECIAECSAMGFDAQFLGWFASTDCLVALVVVEALNAQQHGFEQSAAQQQSGSGACSGCAWTGSECAWFSQGNWGSNVAYSGAVSTCDSACCGR